MVPALYGPLSGSGSGRDLPTRLRCGDFGST